MNKRHFLDLNYFLKHVFGCAVSVSLSLAASASADVSIQEVDVSLLPDLRQPGQAWERISGQSVHLFDGLDVPLIHVSGTRKSWLVESASLRQWAHEFPQARSLMKTVRLPDGSVIGGPSANHLRFIKHQDQASFEMLPGVDDLYWTDYLDGANLVFAKKSKGGALFVFDGEELVVSG